MKPAIAIVGMACRYPEANSPNELWENVLAQRRAFRRIPGQRLRLSDYFSADPQASDTTYCLQAAVIKGYEFDRARFRVAGRTYRSADLAHWLALDVAAEALADAGFSDGEPMPKETTGVIVGNTLTGEFSRANLMRLRWPFVRRAIEMPLAKQGWSPAQRDEFLKEVEAAYKAPFPEIGEETLAGSLSNTIAGRICNHFDLKGGGYTIDGACASSLLAVANACSALAGGDLDMAVAGGVDLSLDPFELVGFAKTSALTPGDMRVYDALSSGFLPGEGCGFVVLMRHEDALEQRRRIYAIIRGCGVSSDGSGGITRPEVEGQLLALRRAYRQTGYAISTVAYFEGHGTGTVVGDATEIKALTRARKDEESDEPAAALGSIKAIIGHTKAAAGIAGLIKATMAVSTQILPPSTGSDEPHPELNIPKPALYVVKEGALWPRDRPLRAGVSAMGFGGIDTHITIEAAADKRRDSLTRREKMLLASPQDAELFLLVSRDGNGMRRQVEHLLKFAAKLSQSELADLAAQLERSCEEETRRSVRCAIVASNPAELESRLSLLADWLSSGVEARLDIDAGLFLGSSGSPARIGYLFPGQGTTPHISGGALRRRFEHIRELYEQADLPNDGDTVLTGVAQPAIITATVAALRVLYRLGIKASIGIGHSLGELSALHWAGAFSEETLLKLVKARAKAMAELKGPEGAMAGVRAGRSAVQAVLNGDKVVIAGLNSPEQTVISGEAGAIARAIDRLQAAGIAVVKLPVSHAFHTPLVRAAAPVFEARLAREEFSALRASVASTVTGDILKRDADLKSLLTRQITSPVRFEDAVIKAADHADLFIEVGPGAVLSRIIQDFIPRPVIAIDAGGPSLKGLLKAVGAAFVSGADLSTRELFADRITKHFSLDWQPKFFINPCETVNSPGDFVEEEPAQYQQPEYRTRPDKEVYQTQTSEAEAMADLPFQPGPGSILKLVRQQVAERVELPPSVVKDEYRLLSDLHLNSITVSQIVTETARRLGLRRPFSPTDYADATVAEISNALEQLSSVAGHHSADETGPPPGVDSWVRTFTVEMVERELMRSPSARQSGKCKVFAPSNHPLADSLERLLVDWEGGGAVFICLPAEPDKGHVGLLADGLRAILSEPGLSRFVLVQHGGGAAALAKTVHLEMPALITCVVDVPIDHPQAAEWVLLEARCATGFTEAHYDDEGRRREPVLSLLPDQEASEEMPLGAEDVLLVTGGGKGITAECALALSMETGVALVLLGRSKPDEDAELSSNLARMKEAGSSFRYYAADITDAEAVLRVIDSARKEMGEITAVLHGAGRNVPQLLSSIDEKVLLNTLAPKLQGLRNILAAIDADRLKLLVTFGSLIARTGMRGEADYALANEWLGRLVEQWQSAHTSCRCINLEWSVWSGAGMGERLGTLEVLAQQGIIPITIDDGVRLLRQVICRRSETVSVVITGRFNEVPTLKLEQPELPFLRFLERPRVYYAGVELIVDAELSADSDPYVNDHVFQGDRLFPAVMGLEAMAQAASALAAVDEAPVFEDVRFYRPIVVPEHAGLIIRLAALSREPGRVEVVLRSAETAFQVDHFRAVCRFGARSTDEARDTVEHAPPVAPIELDLDGDLYGEVLFQSGRFRRLRRYLSLSAKECLAEIDHLDGSDWFGRYLPGELVLCYPAARDASIHAIQACIPHATLLPVGVDLIEINSTQKSDLSVVNARERSREGNLFTYDLEVADENGDVRERWEGLQLRVVDENQPRSWAVPLLGPYLERRIEELISGAEARVAVERDWAAARRSRSDRAIQRALGIKTCVKRRPDGKPQAMGNGAMNVSAAHAGNLTIAVAAKGAIGCDVEAVISRAASVWRDLLGQGRLALARIAAEEMGEDLHIAATRVWAASECLVKAGAMVNSPLLLKSHTQDGWVVFAAGELTVATYAASVRGSEGKHVFGVLMRSDNAGL